MEKLRPDCDDRSGLHREGGLKTRIAGDDEKGEMYNPNRLSRSDNVSRNAPKGAHDLDDVASSIRDHLALLNSGVAIADPVPPDNLNFQPEHLRFTGSLDPNPAPEPPMRESLREGGRLPVRSGGGNGERVRFLVAISLGVVIATIIALEFLQIQNVAGPQHPATDSVAARLDGNSLKSSTVGQSNAIDEKAGSETLIAASGASEPKSTGGAPADQARKLAAVDSTAPAGRPSPARPAISTPARDSSVATPSMPEKPTPIVATPPAAKPGAATTDPRSVATANPAPVGVPQQQRNLAPTSNSVTRAKTVVVEAENPLRPLRRDDIETLLKQGKDFVSVGDFASARIVFGRVAEAHDARGALAFAATYDPIVLAGIGAKGATPDVVKARQWYAKARDLGSRAAVPRLQALANNAR